MTTTPDRTAFIRANTRLLAPPLVPEILLHLAEESLPIWTKTEEELGQINLPPPFWAFAWAGGQALARYLLDHSDTVTGKSLLDIGSGSGLVAIAAMIAGAGKATANDIDAFAIEACRMNAKANDIAIDITHVDLMGTRAGPVNSSQIVCLGDVFYERDLAAKVMIFAADARKAGSRVLAGDPKRSYFPHHHFAKLAEYAVPVTRELEDNEIKNTAIWELTG